MIGLFLGDTEFPKIVLSKVKSKKQKYFIIDLSKKNKFKKDKNSYRISIGKFGSILKLIHEKECKKVLFAGKIAKPNLSLLRLDVKGIYYIPRVIKAYKKGDAAIIKSIISILKDEKISVVRSNLFNNDLTVSKGNYTKLKPVSLDKKDINTGINFFKKLNPLDHIQAIIVREGKILLKESKLGTSKMISNSKNKKGGILIKFPKKKQDLRIDLPTIGIKTLKESKKQGLKGIVLKSNQNIFLNKKDCIDFANKNKIFISVI